MRGGWRVADPPNSPQHLVWADARRMLPEPPDQVFAVVRDPVARLASEHRWQAQGRRGTKLGKWLAKLPFSLWLRVMLAAARRHPHVFDNHLRPQADFVPEEARIFRLEDGLDKVTHWMAETTGEALDDKALPHAIPSGAGPEVSLQDRGLIGAAFAVDFARFGYARSEGVSGVGVFDVLATALAPVVVYLDRRGRL